MKKRNQVLAGTLIAALASNGILAVPAFADTVSGVILAPKKVKTVSTPSNATESDAEEEDEEDGWYEEELINDLEDAATPSNTRMLLLDEEGEDAYILEAENLDVVEYSGGSSNIKYDRIEMQWHETVTFNLQAAGVTPGSYLISVYANGNTEEIPLAIAGKPVGSIDKASSEAFADEKNWWDSETRQEFYYHGVVELTETDTTLQVSTGNDYLHLDWLKLQRVEEAYWLEAEDKTVASYTGDAGAIKDDIQVEMNGSSSVTFDLSQAGISDGLYELYASLNGNRESFAISVDGTGWGELDTTPALGKFAKGTCLDRGPAEVSLTGDSKLTLTDINNTWGHLDYIRLVRIGDAEIPVEPESVLRYECESYYDRINENGTAADLQPEGTIQIPLSDLDDFQEGNYTLKIRANGNRTRLMVLVNGVPVGMICRTGSDFTTDGLREAAFKTVLHLAPGDTISLYAPGTADLGPYGWVDCVTLEPASQEPEKFPDPKDCIVLEAEDFWPDETEAGGQVANINNPAKKLELPILEADGFQEGDYQILIYTTGTMKNYTVSVNGEQVLSGARAGSGYELQYLTRELGSAPVSLKPGDMVTIQFPEQDTDNYGNWVDAVHFGLCQPYEKTEHGVTITASSGIVFSGADSLVTPLDDAALEEVRQQFDISPETSLSFYDISLRYDGQDLTLPETVRISLPIPEGYDPETMSLYQLSDGGVKTKLEFGSDGDSAVFEAGGSGRYGLINEAVSEDGYYLAKDYYDRVTGPNGRYADLQPGDEIRIPVTDLEAFAEGSYQLSVRANGNRTKLFVKVNGEYAGVLSRESTDFGETEDMTLSVLPEILSLSPGDEVSIYAPGQAEYGPFGWIDYVSLKPTAEGPEPLPEAKAKITLEAEDFWPDVTEADGQAANINNPAKKLELPILASDGFAEDDYLLYLYTTGTMRSYVISVNGVPMLTGTRNGSGYDMSYMEREVAGEMLHLKPGDLVTIQFPEQDADNYGNWVDRVVFHTNRRPTGSAMEDRWGGRISKEKADQADPAAAGATSQENGALIYQGEAYYTSQSDNPAADLQPGEQILIPVSDHRGFVDGDYRLTIRSCGNREAFVVKVNGIRVGSISRRETNYGMDAMTDDSMGGAISLKAGDILAIEGQTGGKYGWVDYVALKNIAKAEAQSSQTNYRWEAEDFYPKQKDNPAADLQPGEEIVIPLGSNPDFPEGEYYIMALECGNRTALDVKVNGNLIGSMTRNETGFSMSSMTLDILERPYRLSPGDTISLCGPGEPGDEGPWGWVDQLILIPAPVLEPQALDEYRYPAAAYGKASLFLAAADLQPEDSLVIPLSDNRSFAEGDYRLMVVSNGTRTRFDVRINGTFAGSIFREPSDYGDNGMAADALPGTWHLKPTDVVTVTAQEGDVYGWVSSVILEPVK
ncbi:MAG TPA: hypothetical protein IAC37_13010 [Candidatus Ventrimonas merdavium]|nr:hypothetical protein [Candidatus Ventrimonas merdavium]